MASRRLQVVSRHERDVVNAAQLERFARAFGLPLFRWKLPLLDELPNVDLNDLYNAEPSLWGYFVEGAPINLCENIKPVRKLVNGSPGILDSLVLDASVASSIIGRHCTDFDDATGAPLQWTHCTLDDVRRANVFQLVELEDLPYAVNVTVGGKTSPPGTEPGSVPGSVLWHGVELDDLSELITSVAPASGAQIIPLYASKNVKEGVELRSRLAAAKGLPIKVKVREHQYCLAFALTDFKLQGRTLRKLILSLSDRKKPPWITICAFYVFISRVRRAASLRLLKRDDDAIKKLEKLRHDDNLYCWEQGYDAEGRWSDERAEAAWKRRQQEKKRASAEDKEKKDQAGKRKRAEQVQETREAAKEAKRSKAAVPPQPAPSRRPVPVEGGKRRAVEAVAGGSGASDAVPDRLGHTPPPSPPPSPPSTSPPSVGGKRRWSRLGDYRGEPRRVLQLAGDVDYAADGDTVCHLPPPRHHHPCHDHPGHLSVCHMSVEGGIGVGKSTCLAALAGRYAHDPAVTRAARAGQRVARARAAAAHVRQRDDQARVPARGPRDDCGALG